MSSEARESGGDGHMSRRDPAEGGRAGQEGARQKGKLQRAASAGPGLEGASDLERRCNGLRQ